jgi:hypothetical protein
MRSYREISRSAHNYVKGLSDGQIAALARIIGEKVRCERDNVSAALQALMDAVRVEKQVRRI